MRFGDRTSSQNCYVSPQGSTMTSLTPVAWSDSSSIEWLAQSVWCLLFDLEGTPTTGEVTTTLISPSEPTAGRLCDGSGDDR
jgi:hypothetical protein